jgi:hypothetical protein
MPAPTTVDQVRSFIGLASYYRRFVEGFARIASPLHLLLKKNTKFFWTDEQQKSFDVLRQKLVNAPILKYPDYTRTFHLYTDASGVGLGAVLSQTDDSAMEHPVAYISRTLNRAERNYAVIEWEGLAVVWAVKTFRHHLLGRYFLIVTDHAPLKCLMKPNNMSHRLNKWALYLQEYDFDIVYRPGRTNTNADALSRLPQINSTVVSSDVDIEEIFEPPSSNRVVVEQAKDPFMKAMVDYLTNDTFPADEALARRIALESPSYTLQAGMLHRIKSLKTTGREDGTLQLVVPKDLRDELLEAFHDDRLAGHLGVAKTFCKLRSRYYWPGMYGDVSNWCQKCSVCLSRKHPHRWTKYPLKPIPVAGPFDRVAVDFVGPLHTTNVGSKYILVFSDYLTKWPEAFATSDQTATTVARVFVEEIICRHSAPCQLLSDRGTAFLSNVVQEICDILGTKKVNTTAYHPQTDGLVERFNRTLIDMLAKVTNDNQLDWDVHIPYCLFAYRTAMQESVKESPFYLLYGREPRLPIDSEILARIRPYADEADYATQCSRLLKQAWQNAAQAIQKAQEKQKRDYDKNLATPPIEVGSIVFLYSPVTKPGLTSKLVKRWKGPFEVVSLRDTTAQLRHLHQPRAKKVITHTNRLKLLPKEVPVEMLRSGANEPLAMRLRDESSSESEETEVEF